MPCASGGLAAGPAAGAKIDGCHAVGWAGGSGALVPPRGVNARWRLGARERRAEAPGDLSGGLPGIRCRSLRTV